MKGTVGQIAMTWGPAPAPPPASSPPPLVQEPPASPAAPRYGNPLPPVQGLPAEEQHLLDALGAIVGHEYVITISLEQGHRIADTVRLAIRNDFARRVGSPVAQADPLGALGGELEALLGPASATAQPTAAPPRATPKTPRVAHPPAPVDEDDPAVLAAEIQRMLHETATIMGEISDDLAPRALVDWIVFVAPAPVDPEAMPAPVLYPAKDRTAAENGVAVLTGVPVRACYAVPAWASLRATAVPIADHPLRLTEPLALGDAIGLLLQGLCDREDESIEQMLATHAEMLGITVPELKERMRLKSAAEAEQKATEKATKKALHQTAPKNRAARRPNPAAGVTLADGMRRLTERQRELLTLVNVDQKSNRVVYLRQEHLPEWASLAQAVEALGGVYRAASKKTQGGWVFPDGVDAMDAIRMARETGEIFDPTLLGFFETQDALADELVGRLKLRSGDRVLDPSAGKGALGRAARRACEGLEIVCVELVPEHQEALRAQGFDVRPGDYLKFNLEGLGGDFDVIVANPPFGAGRVELLHLRHMLDQLGSGGRLGVIMPQSLLFRDDSMTRDLRAELKRHSALITENGRGAFAASGTMVSTVNVSLVMV